MRLSHEANGILRSRRTSQGRTARAVWHHRGARVARQRCPILREGRWNIPVRAGDCKAIKAKQLPLGTIDKLTTFSGGEPDFRFVERCVGGLDGLGEGEQHAGEVFGK